MKKWLWLLAGLAALAAAAALRWIGGDFALQHAGREYAPPSREFWLGNDLLGRDVAALALRGLWIALAVGGLAALLALAIGTALGLLAGWRRGWCEQALLGLAAALSAIPALLLVLALTFMLGRGLTVVILAIGSVSWIGLFRLVRAETVRLRQQEFVLAARAAGAGPRALLRRHLLPNLAPLLLVQFALQFVYAVETEVVLAFLGVGEAELASWGRTLFYGVGELERGHVWPTLAVSTLFFLLVLALHRLADHLRDAGAPQAPAR